ncbi:Component of the cap-binding complex (CBC) [Chamberlinius hualienensis]
MSYRRPYDDSTDIAPSRKRRRLSSEPVEIEDRLESLITRVGEKSTSSLESNLDGLAGVLEADLPNFKSKILFILADCAVKMPEKITVYTTLVGLLNARNYNFGGEFVELLVHQFKDALKGNAFETARILLRFLSDLVNCHVISAGSLLSVFESMVEVISEEGILQLRGDWYVYAVLSSLPWVGRELYEKKEQELDGLLSTIDEYIGKRPKRYSSALRVWGSNPPHPQEEYLDNLWATIRKLRNDKWQEKHIVRPYLAFDGILCEALQHNLPNIQIPPHHESCNYPAPSVVFRLFDYTDCPEGPVLPGAHSVERFLIEEHLHRIIQQCHAERKDCAAQLLTFPGKQKVPLDYMIVEVIFAELFQIPVSRYIEIYYGSLLIELCKLQPSTMPQVLALATQLMYQRIETMNVSCFDRFVNWFSYHLSNFEFHWTWDDWLPCLEKELDHPQPTFVREVLHKCMRLSYHQRIVDILPEQYESLIPLKPLAVEKYGGDGAAALPGQSTAQHLASLIKSKCSPDDVLALIKDLPNPLQEEDISGEPSYNPLKIEVFIHTLLTLACKSFSHAFAAIAKFHTVFKQLAETEEAQICLLRNVIEVWVNHPQMLCVLVDKMLKTQIVECFAVANWIFSKEMIPNFNKMFVWELLHITIRKMNKHVQKLQKEVDDARQNMVKDEMDTGLEREDKEKPTAEMVERMEEKLEAAQSDQKNLFLIIFQRFIMILTEHIAKCEGEEKPYNTNWYKWTIGRLQQVLMTHHEQVYKYISTLENLLFTSDIDPHILEVFQQFASMRC